MTPLISVVVGTRNRPVEYGRFIDSVLKTATVPTEVVVGDATSQDIYAYSFLTNGETEVVVFQESPPMGMLRGYNSCFRKCRGEWVVWFNEDCELLPGWQQAALDYMTAHPEVGLGAVYFKDKKEDGTYEDNYRVYEYPRFVPHANFGFLRREFGDSLGWFDERLGWGYGSDSAFGLQVIESGKAVSRIPGCKCIHHREWDKERTINYQLHRDSDLAKFKEIWSHKYHLLRMQHLSKFGYLKQPETIE